MVYFSNREMKILRLMTKKRAGVAIDELMRILEVSKRTVYRELSSLEDTVERMDLKLEKSGKLYQLRGHAKDFEKLHQELQEPLTIEWVDVEKRQIALLATIALQTEQSFTQTKLAEKFNVSLTTIQEDFNRLNEVLAKYNIRIERSEDYGLYLSGSEVYIRLYLSQILSNEINEFDFFQVLAKDKNDSIETEAEYLLTLVDSSILRMVYQAFESKQPDVLSQISDDILMSFVMMLTVSLMRLEIDETISHTYAVDYDQLFPFMQQILSIVKIFEPNYKLLLNTTEVSFFAMQLRGINVQKSHSIFQQTYDMELGYNIKYLIRLASTEFQFNFNSDNVLYHDLINHVGAALKRLELSLPEMENEVLTKLKHQYSNLYAIVEEKLIEVFSPTIFSEQEIGYVVTHFASSFEKHGYRRDLKILVVCTSGIGTSKILKTRLERSIADIEEIKVVRAIDLNEVDVEQYGMIFSTITLPGFEYDYTLINPILDDQEIETIKQRLSKYSKMEKITITAPQKINKQYSFDKIKRLIHLAEGVIADFEVIPFNQKFSEMTDYIHFIFEENLNLKNKINQRLKNSPLAIPETGIMLLHTTDDLFETPVLKLHHLEYSIPAMGMDRQPTMVDRIIVMLGPEPMDELTTEFLGTISSSIIENEKYTKLYQEGTTAELKELFEHLSVEVLQNLLR